MRLLPLCGAAALLLSGCVNQAFYVQQSVTYDRYERDFVGCATHATQEVPDNTQVGWAPYVGIYSYDPNAELRQRNFGICMRDKGYSEVELPYCQGAAAEAARSRMNDPQNLQARMTINSETCYVLDATGSPFIYSDG